MLENIKYLSNFSKADDKVLFLKNKTKNIVQAKTQIHNKTIEHLQNKKTTHINQIINYKKNIIEQQKEINKYKVELYTLRKKNKEKNNKINKLMITSTDLKQELLNINDDYDTLKFEFANLIEHYTHSNEARGSLENVNDSLQNVNNTLTDQLNDVYINLLATREDLDKHKHKTIWDILFNKIK